MKGIELLDEMATRALAQQLASGIETGLVIYLEGDLGAGKTCFTRALLQALGVEGRVKSPTYSLMEPYSLPCRNAWHLDLYRIADPDELEWLGLDALFDDNMLVLVEWPEKGEGRLPRADVIVHLSHAGEGRLARFESASQRGKETLSHLFLDADKSGG